MMKLSFMKIFITARIMCSLPMFLIFHVDTMCNVSDYVNDAFHHAVDVIDAHFDGTIGEQRLEGISGTLDWCLRAENRYSESQINNSPSNFQLFCNGIKNYFLSE